MKSNNLRFWYYFQAVFLVLALILAAASLNGLAAAYGPRKAGSSVRGDNWQFPASPGGGPALAITKQDAVNGGAGPARPGETIDYQVVVTNTDVVTATNVFISDTVDSNTTFTGGSLVVSPVALADSYMAPVDTAVNQPAPGVLANDWNDYNGTVTAFDAVSAQGGTVAVNSDGSFVYTPPSGFSGQDSFSYTVANSAGSDTAVVTIMVGDEPACVADVYAATGNIAIELAAPGVMANDGGAQISVTAVQGSGTNVGSATTTAQGSTVTLNADGSFTYEPLAGLRGADNFTYTIDNAFNQPQTCTVTVNLSDMVWFVDNTAVGSNEGTFANPFQSMADFNTAVGPQAGDVIYIFRGSGYNEAAGITLQNNQQVYGGAVRFDTVFTAAADSNAAYQTFASAPAGAATLVAATGGNGFDLAADNRVGGLDVGDTPVGFAFDGVNVGTLAVDTVNVTGSGGILRITGSGDMGTAVTFGTISSTSSPGAAIDLTNVTGTMAVTGVGSSLAGTAVNEAVVHINGGTANLNYPGSISKTNAGEAVLVENGHSGALTFSGPVNATFGTGLQFDNAEGSYQFSGSVTLNGDDAGIDILNGSDGSFTWDNASITDPSGKAFYLLSSNATVSYTGSISDVDDLAVHVDNHDSGSMTFNGTVVSNGTGVKVERSNGGTVTFNSDMTLATTTGTAALFLSNNSGATVNFTGNISINNTSVAGFRAVGGGTVNATGAASDITTTTGTAVTIQNTDIGPSGVTFRSVSANGAPNGILLDSTGSAGGLHITGSGTTADSGGIIQQTTGDSISLANTSDVSLANMQIVMSRDDAIHVDSVAGLAITGSDINNIGNGPGDDGLDARELTGTVSIENSTFERSASNHVLINNSSGILNALVISGTTFLQNISFTGVNGVNLTARGTAVVDSVRVENSSFTDNVGSALLISVQDTAVVGSGGQRAVINSNSFSNNTSGVNILQDGAASITFDITNNLDMNGQQGQPINVASAASSSGGALTGRITGNSIGTGGAGSGSATGDGIRLDIQGDAAGIFLVDNNTIAGIASGTGIFVRRSAPAASGPNLDVTVSNNNVAVEAAGLEGIFLNARDGLTLRTDMTGNTSDGALADFWLQEDLGGQLELVGTAVDCTTQIGNTNTAVNGTIVESPPASCTIIAGPINTAMSLNRAEFVAEAAEEESGTGTAVYQPNARQLVSAKVTGAQPQTPDGLPPNDVAVSIPQLPAGKSVTLKFAVTVNDPFPDGVEAVSNQAFAAADGTPPVPSDDPDSGDFGDPTVTPVMVTQYVYLPLIMNNYTNLPDLVVTSITPSATDIEVVITNQGNAAVTDDFWVDVYFNPSPPPTAVNQTIETMNIDGLVWGITSSALPLHTGESLTLNLASPYYDGGRSRFSGVIPSGTLIYAQVDSANAATSYGAVLETHEAAGGVYNNVTGPVIAATLLRLDGPSGMALDIKKGGLALRPSS